MGEIEGLGIQEDEWLEDNLVEQDDEVMVIAEEY